MKTQRRFGEVKLTVHLAQGGFIDYHVNIVYQAAVGIVGHRVHVAGQDWPVIKLIGQRAEAQGHFFRQHLVGKMLMQQGRLVG